MLCQGDNMELQSFEDEYGMITFEADAFDELVADPKSKEKLVAMCNLVKYNTEIQRSICELVDAQILLCTEEDGSPSNMDEVKKDIANNDINLAYLVTKYDLVLWTDEEITEQLENAMARDSDARSE